MTGFAARLAMRARRLAVLVVTPKGSRLTRGGALKLFELLVECLDNLTKARVFRFEFVDALIARCVLKEPVPAVRPRGGARRGYPHAARTRTTSGSRAPQPAGAL
jgi:hypothetical protein